MNLRTPVTWYSPWNRHAVAFVNFCRRKGDRVRVRKDSDGLYARITVERREDPDS